jgi:D-sedoheptulose 7-phosphate isomerase
MSREIDRAFEESLATLRATQGRLAGRIAEAVQVIVDSYKAGGGVFAFGNGGSAADAQHLVGELVGRFLKERRPLRAEALSANVSALTALANDYGVEAMFARLLEANGRPGDVAIGLSTSGDSPNVVAGLAKARALGLRTIALTGAGGGRCAALADVLLDVPSKATPRIQEAHVVIYHIICEGVERAVDGGAA